MRFVPIGGEFAAEVEGMRRTTLKGDGPTTVQMAMA
jgi:hypothetical protein